MIRRDPTPRNRASAPVAPGVNFIGYTHLKSGLGGAARGNFRTLSLLGACLNFPFPYADGVPGTPYSTNFHHWHPEPPIAESARDKGLLQAGRKHIGFWVSETTGLSRDWVTASDAFDEIWTPSTFCRAIFAGHGIRKPIRVWPHTLWRPRQPRALQRVDRPPGFTFLVAYDSHSRISRKNPDGAIAAFRAAFRNREDVRLVIKIRNAQPGEEGLLRAVAGGDSRVTIVSSELSEFAMNDLMSSAHALVSLHRSEGFGLHIAEAMAAGQVCIISGCGGCLDFATQDRAHWVAVKETPVSDYYFRNHGGAWWNPDIGYAAGVMRHVWDTYGSRATSELLDRASRVAEELSPTLLAESARTHLMTS